MLRKEDALYISFTVSEYGRRGVQVSGTRAAADTSGLLVGDVVLEDNGVTVCTPADANRAVRTSAPWVRLLVAGGTRRMLVRPLRQSKIGVTAENRDDGP